MRIRTSPHRASVASLRHTVGERAIRLLPVDPFNKATIQDVAARYRAACPDASEGECNIVAAAMVLFHCWDDPDVEWVTDADPDTVMDLRGADLARVGAALRAEMLSPTVYRLGMVPVDYSEGNGQPSLMLAAFLHARGLVAKADATPEAQELTGEA